MEFRINVCFDCGCILKDNEHGLCKSCCDDRDREIEIMDSQECISR